MFLKKKNIVVEVPDDNKAKVQELLNSGYNEYKRVNNDKTSRNKRKTL